MHPSGHREMANSILCVCPFVRQIVRWRNSSKVEEGEFTNSHRNLKYQLKNINQNNEQTYVQLLMDEIELHSSIHNSSKNMQIKM